jgi:predicted RNA-binding protein YlxR (DUF448 family)
MAKVRRVPQRQCVACRQMRPKRELIRVVRTPAGDVRVDATGKVSGRGAYVCPSVECADLALRAGRLQHALEVPTPEDVAAALREMAGRTTRAPSGTDTHDNRRPRHAGV